MHIRETKRELSSDGTMWVTIVCYDHDKERGMLEYTEPNPERGYEVFIQELLVAQPRRQGIGTLLINHLKGIVKTQHNSAQIVVYLAPPGSLEQAKKLNGLARFYESNGFLVGRISCMEAIGRYQF